MVIIVWATRNVAAREHTEQRRRRRGRVIIRRDGYRLLSGREDDEVFCYENVPYVYIFYSRFCFESHIGDTIWMAVEKIDHTIFPIVVQKKKKKKEFESSERHINGDRRGRRSNVP